ncbi:hypothetical protein [Streptomyces sp. SID13726]|uniref:DUF7691 family protein n=1 Tax=Streptomyces sp. SID13726 TaxID=2706058 RepID=UPI0013B8AE85|nr:hypothetical protein [Streptomyces sp. SID13726]NEB02892.1 hypothetical protein [Streptomyces sp. SID13726]
MAEQYLSAYAINADVFAGIVGSDDTLVRTALGRIGELAKAHKLMRATETTEVEHALREIVTGRLDPSRPGGYTWLLELLGPALGTPLGALTLPGRGWHRLDEAFRAWQLTALADLWGRCWAFPWRDTAPDADPWPFPMLASKADLDRIRAELARFDTDRIHDDYELLPNGDDDDAEEVEWLLATKLPAFVDGALNAGGEMLLLRDGSK